jgi:hypothetical protein
MKKKLSMAMLSSALVVSGCASTGGLATSANGGCNTGMSTAVGALLGAAIGASVGDSTYAATGAALGGALFAAGCIMVNAQTVQKKSAAEVEAAYKRANNGKLPQTTRVQQYSTVILPNQTVATNQNITVKSDVTVVEGVADPLQRVQEKLVLKDATGKVIRELVKDVQVSTTNGYESGNFENSFSWKFPASVSRGQYVLDTELLVNGKKIANNTRTIKLV